MIPPGSLVDDILGFWFGRAGEPDHGEPRRTWWLKDPAFDAEIRRRFLAVHERAATGGLDDLAHTAEGALALIVVLDQFPRNMFRGQPAMYATDDKARAVARITLDEGFDQQLFPVQRIFIYLPFEHSETHADQKLSVKLFTALPRIPKRDEGMSSALRHREIVERFGRFPHRNAILGRETTAEEAVFLKEPNSSF